MDAVRHRLRFAVVVWLLAQAASLSAFVPMDCCARHTPMPAPAGASCHRQPEAPKANTECACRMTAVCDGPAAALLGVLSYHGVLPDVSSIRADAGFVRTPRRDRPFAVPLFSPPDAPPPRS